MKLSDFKKMCAELELAGSGKGYFGVVGDWPVWLTCTDYYVMLFLDVASIPEDAKESLNASLKGWGKVADCKKQKLSLTVRPRKYPGAHADAVREALKAVSAAGFKPNEVCPKCGQTGCDVAAVCGVHEFRPTHRACLQGNAEDISEKADKNAQNGSYLLGILGAILGMLVGTLPTLLTVVFLDYEYAILFALMPVCAYFGYKLFGGKMNTAAIVVTVIMAVLGVYMVMFECAVYSDIAYGGYLLRDALPLLLDYMLVGENWVILTGDLWVEFLFAALGVWFSWRLISRTSKSALADAEAVIELAVPYPPNAANASDPYGYTE